ncbi:FliC/FljB family flagellin [Citrobacter koseri]|uniref:FliC/FljB family flagellin n=1 Tax=Citrobacter koseri TaxID=545 RepID=UPI00350FC57B
MAQVINTNSLSLLTQNNLNKSQSSLGSAIERLSSGLRINSAKDDAAGQAIANRFTANIRGLTQASRNANDGISIAQTTEGALNEINNNLQRIRELAVQANNNTNSDSDLSSIQDEITARLAEIDRVSEQTQFNGKKVLSETQSLKIQVGANDNETITIDLKEVTAEKLGLKGFNVSSFKPTELSTADDFTKAFGADAGVTAVTVAENTANDLAAALGIDDANVAFDADSISQDKSGNLYAKVTITAADADEVTALKEKGIDVKAGEPSSFYIALKAGDADITTTPGTAAFEIDTDGFDASNLKAEVTPTANPLDAIDKALSQIDQQRSSLGAIQNRFESAITNLGNTVNNLSSARSRIEDADYATEVSNMSRAQILQQAGTSVLAQANQVPQNVLSLLR